LPFGQIQLYIPELPILTHIAAKNRTKVKYGLFLC